MNKNQITGILTGILLIIFVSLSGKIWEHVDAGEIVVIQDAIDGELHVRSEPGWAVQAFGTATHYKKSFQFWFSDQDDDGDTDNDNSIKIRFNDGGHAMISGSVRINLPQDEKSVVKLHTIFGSQGSIEQALIRPTIEKSIYMTGPLMSSKESYAEKRNDLLTYIEDQATKGVYRTTSREKKTKDELSGEEKTITKVEIVERKGVVLRTSSSPLKEFSVSLASGTLALNSIAYDPTVEKQIASQQQATMQVQTAMANAKRAQQDAITVAKQGEASAAKAKWQQEVVKAKLVTEAQQKLEVQELATLEAALYKKQQILKGQGDAERKRLIMSADGALKQKLETIEVMTKYWADAYSKRNVPQWYQSGSGGAGNADSEFNTFMNMANIANAQKIGLNLNLKKGGKR